MGLIDGLMGNATTISNNQAKTILKDVLIPDEDIQLAFVLIRDLIIFTDYRLILVNKQGVTGKKTEYKTLPYGSISRFSVETSGHFDFDAELKIWISGNNEPAVALQFRRDKNINQIQQALALAILT